MQDQGPVLVHHDLSGRCLVDGGGEEMRPWVCGFCEFWQGEHPQGWYSENKWGGVGLARITGIAIHDGDCDAR